MWTDLVRVARTDESGGLLQTSGEADEVSLNENMNPSGVAIPRNGPGK